MTDEELREVLAENKRLEKLVYVSGLWRCPKCEFQLIQANLNAQNGTVTARDEPGDKCPNCHGPLWRVTEREAGNRLIDDMERLTLENAELRRVAAQVRAETVEEAISAIGKKAAELEIIQCCDHAVPSRDGTAECCGSPDLMLSGSDAQTAIRALLNKDGG